jgi:hypothetical protein
MQPAGKRKGKKGKSDPKKENDKEKKSSAEEPDVVDDTNLFSQEDENDDQKDAKNKSRKNAKDAAAEKIELDKEGKEVKFQKWKKAQQRLEDKGIKEVDIDDPDNTGYLKKITTAEFFDHPGKYRPAFVVDQEDDEDPEDILLMMADWKHQKLQKKKAEWKRQCR